MRTIALRTLGKLDFFKKLENELFDSIPNLIFDMEGQSINMEDIGEIKAYITDFDDVDDDGIVKLKELSHLYLDNDKNNELTLFAECTDGSITCNFNIEDLSYVMEYIIEKSIETKAI